MLTDMDLPELWHYRSDYEEPEDFDEFWRTTCASAREFDLDAHVVPVEAHLQTIDVYDVTFAGFGGHPVRAWLRMPKDREGPLPAIVQFHGYASGRGAPMEDLLWASAGYVHLLMDTRGQGGDYAGGATGDPVGSGPSYPGFLTRGIEDKETYFYRRVFTDAVRAIEAVRSFDAVDRERVAVVGNSQGGGIALAAAGLVPDVAALYTQSPFLCDIRRATRITGTAPYSEITGFLAARRKSVDKVFETLSYFDGIGFAGRGRAPAWFSAGLMDYICPPSTAFGAYHRYAGEKRINVWEYNGHDAGGADDLAIILPAFRSLLRHDHPIGIAALSGTT